MRFLVAHDTSLYTRELNLRTYIKAYWLIAAMDLGNVLTKYAYLYAKLYYILQTNLVTRIISTI
jgi:hypothetical protein